MSLLRASLPGFIVAFFVGPALAGPLEEAWEHCVLSDRPHDERLAKLEAAGWKPIDEQAATYAAHGRLLAGLSEAPLSDERFWSDVEKTFLASAKHVDVFRGMILNARNGPTGQQRNLQKGAAVLQMLWRVDDPRRETYCGYLQPEKADPSLVPSSMGAPFDVRDFSVGTVSDLFIRMQNPKGDWAGTIRVVSSAPNLDHLRTLSPDFPDIGFSFSSFVGIWE